MGANISSIARPPTDDRISEKVAHLSIHDVNASSVEPVSKDGSISPSNVASWEDEVAKSDKIKLSRTILVDTDLKTALASRYTRVADAHVFNHQLEFKTDPITSQKSSGRCWLFATTNVLRYSVMKKLNLKEFQLSQSYVFFWDKLNKSNYYLENVIETADLPLDDRIVSHLSKDLISDGGQWDMAVNIIETYGVIPQPIHPESFSSSSSSGLNTLLKLKLREHALILRAHIASIRSNNPSLTKEDIVASARSKKEELMKEVWTIMTIALGTPPNPNDKFTWDYYDKDDKPHSWTGTPIEFYKAFSSTQYPPAESFSLINDPRNAYKKLYTVDRLGNIWGARPVLYVNTEIDDLKAAVVKMIKAGQPVFFGCDVGQFSDRTVGIMDTALHQFENAFDVSFGLTKAQRLQVNESQMTHAMVISGVHLDTSGKPVRYKVENSWGPDVGDKGYFVMSDAWFEQFVYQVVVPRTLAPKELVKVFDQGEKTVLPPWDPMGSLA
ncbi:peptidase C1B, bleomycin hydrolase [Schizopora paradoxa]|uniref:Cysteine proteinase 1, mitochondrial n=1 Tax=Schizopora paradoxa TaxID=27342 RepID=A0A0H2SR67_9AGAM|nr:peptidase C1B, bleomycin hydrolase [Schizopora paradoxa]